MQGERGAEKPFVDTRNFSSHFPSPWGTPHRHGSSRNPQRSSQFNLWAPFLSSDSHSSNFPPLSFGQSSEEDIVMPPGTNQGHNRHNTQLPRPSMTTELQGDDISEWHALAADIEGRQRLVSEGIQNSKKEMPNSGSSFRSRIVPHWNIVLPPTLRSVSSSRETLGRRERVNEALTRAYVNASIIPRRPTGAVKILFILACLIGKIHSQPSEVQNLTALKRTLPSERHKNFQSRVSLGLGLGIGLGLGLLIIVCCFILYIAHKHNMAQAAEQAAQQAELELQMVQQTLVCRAFVESFPVYSLPEEGTDVEECPICILAFKEGSNLMLLPLCGHVFHRECMVNYWRGLAEERPCPLCRRDYQMWQPDVESG